MTKTKTFMTIAALVLAYILIYILFAPNVSGIEVTASVEKSDYYICLDQAKIQCYEEINK